jgi:cold shock protein
MIGTVKFFQSERGFGFIIRDEDGADAFFHVNDLAPGTRAAAMARGSRMMFDVERSAQGLRAVKVTILPTDNVTTFPRA